MSGAITITENCEGSSYFMIQLRSRHDFKSTEVVSIVNNSCSSLYRGIMRLQAFAENMSKSAFDTLEDECIKEFIRKNNTTGDNSNCELSEIAIAQLLTMLPHYDDWAWEISVFRLGSVLALTTSD